VLALEPLEAVRIVARPQAIDEASWYASGDLTILRIAPDEAIAIGQFVDVETWDSTEGITESETGLVGAWLTTHQLEQQIDWMLPIERPALAQGKVAGVPAKVWVDGDRAFLVVYAAYAADLEARLR
jgi:hypothetical protein